MPLPDEAPHLLERLAADAPGTRITTSVNRMLQRQTQEIVNRYARDYASNHIHNLAALIADAETGEVLAYAGNVTFKADARKGNQVDIITSPRSTGSILKPFLYAAMLHDGQLLPGTLVSDVPLNLNGFSPQNYNKTFYGAVPAHRAIERSLNVPLVRMLSAYNTGAVHVAAEKGGHDHAALFRRTLRGFADPGRRRRDVMGPHRHVMLHWRVRSHITGLTTGGMTRRIFIRSLLSRLLRPIRSALSPTKGLRTSLFLSAASIWFAFEAMSALNRPEEEADWQQFGSIEAGGLENGDELWRTGRLGDRDNPALYGRRMGGQRFGRRPSGTDRRG
ncbi:MAG: penicillin-binding transpeptidase domain-containing protein [Parabacteroides merdae]